MTNIALTRGNSENSTPPQDIPSIMKKTYQIKTAKLVSIFAARWRSIRKYFRRQDDQESEARKSNSSKKTPHTPTLRKKA